MTEKKNSRKINVLVLHCISLVIFISNIEGRTQKSAKEDLKTRR